MVEPGAVDGMLVYLLDVAVKATLVLACGAVATWVLRRRAAAERHMVWTVAAAAVLALPLCALAFPSWQLAVPVPRQVDATPPAALAPDVAAGLEATGTAQGTTDVSSSPPFTVLPVVGDAGSDARLPERARGVSAAVLVLLIWLAGALLLLMHLTAGLVRVHALARRARPVRDGVLAARARQVAERMNVRRPVRLLEADADTMPMTFGLLRATLMLPANAATWTVSRQESVLRHELAHIRRRDSLSQFVAALGCALYWFNPLIWLAQHRLRVEREHACDDAVLAAGARPSDYASALLEIARTAHVERATSLAAIAMARRSHLRARLTALLEQRQRCDNVPATVLVPAWLGAFALVLPMSSVRPTLADWETTPISGNASAVLALPMQIVTPPEPLSRGNAAALTRPADAASVPAPRALTAQDDCMSGRNTSTSINANDERRTIKWRGRGCEGEVIVEGTVQFDGAFERIVSISRGGFVRMETEEGGVERRIVIEPGASGLRYEYAVDGRSAAFDAAGQAWLAAQLQFLFRRTGFLAEERATAILQRQGLPGLLAEIELLHGDYPRAQYYTVAIETGRLDMPTIERLLTSAGSTIESDHYATQIITAIAGRYEFTPELRDAYIGAVSGIESDHYKHSAFETLLERGHLDARQVAAVLNESGRIGSDHYRATLLQNIVERYRLEPAIRGAYIDAAAGIESDHYEAAVLEHLLAQDALSAGEIAQLLDASGNIDSDHYQAQILSRVGQMDLRDAPLQQAFVRAAANIDSDHYLQEVLSRTVERGALDAAVLGTILEAAASIDSDHYLSELMIGIAERHRLEGDLRARFMRLMDGIGSEHYQGRVAAALLRQG